MARKAMVIAGGIGGLGAAWLARRRRRRDESVETGGKSRHDT